MDRKACPPTRLPISPTRAVVKSGGGKKERANHLDFSKQRFRMMFSDHPYLESIDVLACLRFGHAIDGAMSMWSLWSTARIKF